MSRLGYKALKLIRMLNESFPTFGNSQVEWLAEDLHIVTGAWRTNVNLDVWRWNAYSRFKKGGGVAHAAGSYTPITELIKSRGLVLSGDEVFGTDNQTTEGASHE